MSIQTVAWDLEPEEPFLFERIGPIANRAMDAMLSEALQFKIRSPQSNSKEVKRDEC